MIQTTFEVYVRIRPRTPAEIATNDPVLLTVGNSPTVATDLAVMEPYTPYSRNFTFSGVFPAACNTASVFAQTMPSILECVSSGYNSTVFAYGSTGSGKTHTMFGDLASPSASEQGLVFLTLQRVLSSLKEASVQLSYLEIYNEHVKDLLAPMNRDLAILEDSLKGIVIPQLSEYSIASTEDLLQLITNGNEQRVMAPTCANQFSTRSHAILQLNISQALSPGQLMTSRLCLIDLAGSERAASSHNRGIRMTEGASINKSLLALSNCINVLSNSSRKGKFIPYRDSKLTRLLKDSLGGRAKTVMIACVSPAQSSYESTLNTLQYAERASEIKVSCKQGIQESSAIQSLRAEIECLKTLLSTSKPIEDNLNFPEEFAELFKNNPELLKNDIVERLSSELKTVKFEKLDLCLENVRLKQQSMRSQQSSQSKDKLILSLQHQVHSLQNNSSSSQLQRKRTSRIKSFDTITTLEFSSLHSAIQEDSSLPQLCPSRLEEARKSKKATSESFTPSPSTVAFLQSYVPSHPIPALIFTPIPPAKKPNEKSLLYRVSQQIRARRGRRSQGRASGRA